LFPTLIALSIKVVALQTKVDIEAKARAHVETFIMESSCELPTPPLKVKMRRFYVLLSKTNAIMNRTILEDFEMTMFLSMKMEMNDTLGSAFVSTFGQW
jgi:hypothetical protein